MKDHKEYKEYKEYYDYNPLPQMTLITTNEYKQLKTTTLKYKELLQSIKKDIIYIMEPVNEEKNDQISNH
jgi:hypothetical protein